jgi:tetratricopeptide (TPR) repeat protein
MRLALSLSLVLAASPALFAADPCSSADTTQKATTAQGFVKQKKFPDAEAPARAALAACPTQALATWALGGSLFGQKRYADTITAMTAVIQKSATVPYAYMWRGQAYYAQTQPDKAVADFQAFLKLAPNAPEAPTIKQILAGLGK